MTRICARGKTLWVFDLRWLHNWCRHSWVGRIRVPHCASYSSLAALEACWVVSRKHVGRTCDTSKTGCSLHCPASKQHLANDLGWGASKDVHDSAMGEWGLQGPTQRPVATSLIWMGIASMNKISRYAIPYMLCIGIYHVTYSVI